MAQLPVSEAAKLVSRSPKTLHRLIKEGKISATVDSTGQRQVETSELIRFFGEIGQGDTKDRPATGSTSQHETPNETVSAAVRLAVLEAELRHAKELMAAKDEQIADLRMSLRLLPAPEPKRSIWAWGKKT
jgi:hypothetical protein